jgi:SAM-dependent methyltransferase
MVKRLPDSTQSLPESADAGLTFQHAYHAVHLTESPTRAVVWTVISEYLAPLIAPTAHVLEIGAGYCYWINSVRAARRVAVDLWEKLPEHAAAGVEPVRHDLSEGLAALGDQTFDAILASNVLEHFELPAVARLVRDVFQRLNPGGHLIVIQPNYFHSYRHYFDDYTHRSIFSHVSLPALLREYEFLIERVEPRFMPYSLRGSRWPIRPWLIRWYLRLPFRPWAGQMLIVAQKPFARASSRAR